MTLVLPRPTERYDPAAEERRNHELEQADRQSWKRTGDVSFAHELYRTSVATVTAATTQTQGQQPLTKRMNIVGTVANANDVVTLPPAAQGRQVLVRNEGANTLQIFPASGDRVNGGSVDASVTLAASTGLTLEAVDATDWYAF